MGNPGSNGGVSFRHEGSKLATTALERRARARHRREPSSSDDEGMPGLNGAPTTPPDRLSSSLDRHPVVCMHAQPHVHAGARGTMRGLDKYFPTRYRRSLSPSSLPPASSSFPLVFSFIRDRCPPLSPRLIIRLRARFAFFSRFSRSACIFPRRLCGRAAFIDSHCEEWISPSLSLSLYLSFLFDVAGFFLPRILARLPDESSLFPLPPSFSFAIYKGTFVFPFALDRIGLRRGLRI